MGPVAARNGTRQLWSDMVDDMDISVVVKRLETFEHKRLRISNSTSGLQLKQIIAEAWGDAHAEQRLCHGMTVVVDDKALALYNITDGDVIHVGLQQCARQLGRIGSSSSRGQSRAS